LLSRYCTFTSLQEAKTAAAINLKFIADNELSDSFSEFEVMMRLFITLPTGISSAEKIFQCSARYQELFAFHDGAGAHLRLGSVRVSI